MLSLTNPYNRVAALVVIVSVLLLAGLVGIGLPYVSADDENLIKVNTISATTLQAPSHTDTVDGLADVRLQYGTATLTGTGLNGLVQLQRSGVRELPATCEGCRFWGDQISFCTGCVDGHTGTLFWSVSWAGQWIGGTQSWTGTWNIIKGTGDLERARGGGEFIGETIGGVITSTYTGKIHFEP